MRLVLAAAMTLCLTPTASAQDYLGSFLGAESYGRQLERSQGSAGTHRPTRRQRQSHMAARPSQARMNELMRRLKPEYERRVERDGSVSANRWLQRTAYRMGLQEGRGARR